jgi:hypothetical protein
MQSQPQNPEPLLDSIRETGRLLNVGRTKVYDLIGTGELETVHIDKRHLVVRESTKRLVKRRAQTAA